MNAHCVGVNKATHNESKMEMNEKEKDNPRNRYLLWQNPNNR